MTELPPGFSRTESEFSRTEDELLRDGGRDGTMFRRGLGYEARTRFEAWGAHSNLVECAEALAVSHQDWTSGDIALALARIFNHVIEEEPV